MFSSIYIVFPYIFNMHLVEILDRVIIVAIVIAHVL